MPIATKIEPKHFYESLPSLEHRTGDIWKGLPCFGLLDNVATDGIVITPACDLANRKCETITYLPIISASNYLTSSAFAYECWQEASAALNKLQLQNQVTPPYRFETALLDELESCLKILTAKQKTTNAAIQLTAYASYVRLSEARENISTSLIESIFTAKEFLKLSEKLVTNSLKSDIHFLPSDGKPIATSAVNNHSVVLFRYPITVPVFILDEAQRTDSQSWDIVKSDRKISRHLSSQHFHHWPMKITTLKDDFLSDLISRYLSTYIRLGSRDFSKESITDIAKQIKEN